MSPTTPPETCPTCWADPKAAPGGYCAPLRCYCGHPECPAYASWGPAKAQQQAHLAALASEASLLRAAERARDRATRRALKVAQRTAEDLWEARRQRAGGEWPPDPRGGA